MITTLILLPAATALVVAVGIPRGSAAAARIVALGGSLATLALALALVASLDPSIAVGTLQLVESRSWVPSLGSTWTLGADALSALLAVLAASVTSAAMVVATRCAPGKTAEIHVLLLLFETAAIGIFVAGDAIGRCFFWEVATLLAALLIAGAGGEASGASRYLARAVSGGLVVLVAVAASPEALSARGSPPAPEAGAPEVAVGASLFLAVAAGAALKAGVFPLHGGLSRVLADAPGAAGLVILGVLLPAGAYVILRAGLLLEPAAAEALAPALALAGILGIVAGAVRVAREADLKVAIAHAVMGQAGFLLVGIAAGIGPGMEGSTLLLPCLGLSSSALLLLGEAVVQGRGARRASAGADLPSLSGGLRFWLVASSLALLGAPPTGAFFGELWILRGAFQWQPAIGIAVLAALALQVAVVIGLCRRVIRPAASVATLSPLAGPERRELAAAALMLLLAVAIGLGSGRLVVPTVPALDSTSLGIPTEADR